MSLDDSRTSRRQHQLPPGRPDQPWRIVCSTCKCEQDVEPAEAGRPHQCESCREFLIVPKQRLAPNAVIGDFVLREVLGEGGRGTVFLAYQKSLDRLCAVKIMHEEYAGKRSDTQELLTEARLAARLNHPNIVQCYAVGEVEEVIYYAMEYVEGKTLKQSLKAKWKLAPARAVEMAQQVVQALDYAWKQQRLVHRDIKPDNIMIGDDHMVKLADFGLARKMHEIEHEGDDIISGTPQYICPERLLSQPMDFRGDMYSLGVVLYQCVTGKAPFTGDTPESIAVKHLEEYPAHPSVHTPDMPAQLGTIIMIMMAKDPDDRFADYEMLLNRLEQVRAQCQDPSSTTIFGMRRGASPTPTPVPGMGLDGGAGGAGGGKALGMESTPGMSRSTGRRLKVLKAATTDQLKPADPNDLIPPIGELIPELEHPTPSPSPRLAIRATANGTPSPGTTVPAARATDQDATDQMPAPSPAAVAELQLNSTAMPTEASPTVRTGSRLATEAEMPPKRGSVLPYVLVAGLVLVGALVAGAVLIKGDGAADRGAVPMPTTESTTTTSADASALPEPEATPVVTTPAIATDATDASTTPPLEPALPTATATAAPVLAPSEPPRLALVALLPDPAGYDGGHEWVELRNDGPAPLSLAGWQLRDSEGNALPLVAEIASGTVQRIVIPADSPLQLNNHGDTLELLDPTAAVFSSFSYARDDVISDTPIQVPATTTP